MAFKVKAARVRDSIHSIMESQDELIARKSDGEEVGLEDDDEAALEDVGRDADLYIANQEVFYD